MNICHIFFRALVLCRLPFSLDQTGTVCLRHIQNVYTVRPVDRDSTSSCDKTYDLISRNWTAALGKTDCNIMDTLYYDSALILGYMKLLLLFTGSLKNL